MVKLSDDLMALRSVKEDLEEKPVEKPSLEDLGIAAVINKLIVDEWEAIDGYQGAIATIQDILPEVAKIFNDIMTEEMIHVGQLQKALSLVQPETFAIEDGEEEAEEQLLLK